jgi:hypothetical protein
MRILCKPDKLFGRIPAKRTGLANCSVNGPRTGVAILHCQMDLRTNSFTICFHAKQAHVQPVVAVAGILEDSQRVLVSGNRASVSGDDILAASSA